MFTPRTERPGAEGAQAWARGGARGGRQRGCSGEHQGDLCEQSPQLAQGGDLAAVRAGLLRAVLCGFLMVCVPL